MSLENRSNGVQKIKAFQTMMRKMLAVTFDFCRTKFLGTSLRNVFFETRSDLSREKPINVTDMKAIERTNTSLGFLSTRARCRSSSHQSAVSRQHSLQHNEEHRRFDITKYTNNEAVQWQFEAINSAVSRIAANHCFFLG